MEKQLNFNSVLSLKEMTLRRIGVIMCNRPSLFQKIANLRFRHYERRRRPKVHTYITFNLSNLVLPESLNKELIPVFKAICEEIARWKLLHEAYFNEEFCLSLFQRLRWTNAGTINYRKTAEQLLHSSSDEFPDVANRLHLACFYCLEDYIPALWRKLPVVSKVTFYDGDVWEIQEPRLELFLPNVLRRVESKRRRNTNELNFFERAALLGNKTLVDYCFSKLSKEEKEASLVRTARIVIRLRSTIECGVGKLDIARHMLASVSRHLLSLMTAEEQNRLFKDLTCEVLSCFLNWPRQDLFLDLADEMWTFMPECTYNNILMTLHDGFVMQDFYFPELFQEFFQLSPVKFRKLFVDRECEGGSFLFTFMFHEDTETLRVVLRSLPRSDRLRLAFSKTGLNLIYQHKYRWPVVEVFLRELYLTTEEKGRLKEAITEHVRKQGRIQWMNKECGRIFELLDEGKASSPSKKSSNDEISTEVKRLCIEEEEKSSQ